MISLYIIYIDTTLDNLIDILDKTDGVKKFEIEIVEYIKEQEYDTDSVSMDILDEININSINTYSSSNILLNTYKSHQLQFSIFGHSIFYFFKHRQCIYYLYLYPLSFLCVY